MNARKFVIANPERCIGCKTCLAACLHAHDLTGEFVEPRLQFVSTLKVSTPITCHHCVDAPCVASCPTGCLYSDESRVGIHEEKCIGCQNCVLACPFGAVTIKSKVKTKRFGNLEINCGWKPVVIKCDLCSHRPEGPACVKACLTEGLMLVDQDYLDNLSKEKRIRTAVAAEANLHS